MEEDVAGWDEVWEWAKAAVVVRGTVKADRDEAVWVARLPPDPAGSAFVHGAGNENLTNKERPAYKSSVRSAVL